MKSEDLDRAHKLGVKWVFEGLVHDERFELSRLLSEMIRELRNKNEKTV